MKPEELRHQMRTLENQELRLQGAALALVLATGVALLIAVLPHWRASLGLYDGKSGICPYSASSALLGAFISASMRARSGTLSSTPGSNWQAKWELQTFPCWIH